LPLLVVLGSGRSRAVHTTRDVPAGSLCESAPSALNEQLSIAWIFTPQFSKQCE